MNTPYIEQDCTFTHEGKAFTANGAFVSDSHVVGYLGKDNKLTDWHGRDIGTYRITSTWKTPHSFVSSTMHQVYALVSGRRYTGRSCGEGMIFKGKLTH